MLQSLPHGRRVTTSLLYPEGFLSPLEIDAAVERALAEDLGRAGDVTSIATIPAGTPARAVVVARKAGAISGLPLVAAAFRRLAPDIEIKAERPRRRQRRGEDRADDHRRRRARRALGRARGAQPARPSLRHRHRDRRDSCACSQGHADAHLLHPQDHAGPARAGEIRGALRRRLQSPLRPRRRDADQGQPHRGRRRHARRAGARARQCRPSGEDRDRGRHARPARARCSTPASPTWCCSTT